MTDDSQPTETPGLPPRCQARSEAGLRCIWRYGHEGNHSSISPDGLTASLWTNDRLSNQQWKE